MYLKEFDVETWMTNHEQNCQYNLADTCVSDMSIHELESLIHKDLMSDLMHMRMDYGPITGSDCLKDAILSLYKTGTRDNIAVAHGAINANEHVMDTLLNKGDHIIALTPSYEQFYSYPASIGCEYDLVELNEDNNWEPVIDDFKKLIKPETKMFILNSPNNPTGTVIKQSLMEELIELARSHSIYILVDEIYRGMNNTLCDSISDMYELGIATASLSKVYSFAGLRLGWVKGPKQLIDEINFRRDYTIISTGPWNDYLATVVLQHKVTKEAFVAKDDSAVMVNSGFLNGMTVKEAIPAMKKYVVEQGFGKEKVNYKLRDWVFSRQRYWGEPIPLVNCPKCGWVALPEEQLPLVLPQVDSYEPTDDGESPLSKMTDWVNTTCPCCGGPAKRETDTMPQWAGSSWYFLRYCDPHNVNALAAKEALDYWMPVDWYNGGMEHTTLHLLYSRFWHKFLYDIGVVSCKEPYAKRTSHGMILGENGEKMSKSRGNVVNPDDVVAQYGADTLRMYEMFIGDFEKTAPWNTSSIKGSKRFLERVAALTDMMTPEEGYSPELEGSFHKMIKKVSEDIEGLKCNTAIAAMMSVLNEIYDKGSVTRGELMTFITLLNPFAPHLTEEINEVLGNREMLARAKWPEYDPAKCVDAAVEIAVQVSGRIKARLMIPTDSTEEAVKALVMADANVQAALAGKTVIKEIYVKGKLYNIVAK